MESISRAPALEMYDLLSGVELQQQGLSDHKKRGFI